MWKDYLIWENAKYAIVERLFVDGSIGIFGGWYENSKNGAPKFVTVPNKVLPKYVQNKIRAFEKNSFTS
jgi:hypothetical protein